MVGTINKDLQDNENHNLVLSVKTFLCVQSSVRLFRFQNSSPMKPVLIKCHCIYILLFKDYATLLTAIE